MKAIQRLSTKIRLYRTSLSITQQEMANTLGLSLRTFQRIETCQSPIDISVIYKICESYDIPFFDLVNPDIKPGDLRDAEFFSNLDTFKQESFLQEKSDFFAIKDQIIEYIRKDPAKLNMLSSVPEFENSPYYLYACNLHFAIGNAKTRAIAGLPDDKYRTLKTFKDASKMIKAWDIGLKYKFPAFKMTSDHETDKSQLKIMGYNFFDFGKMGEDKSQYGTAETEPIIFGVFQLL